MQSRMTNPMMTVPGAMQAAQALGEAIRKGADARLLTLVQLRASQINGCSYCVDMHARELKEAGEGDERLWSVAAWRESPLFSVAERAVLALTEVATRIAGQGDAVPDAIWNEAAKHFDKKQLGAIRAHHRDDQFLESRQRSCPPGRRRKSLAWPSRVQYQEEKAPWPRAADRSGARNRSRWSPWTADSRPSLRWGR